MANKWQIEIDVDEEDVARLLNGLDHVSTPDTMQACEDLRDQIRLSWIEREVEMIPPPSEWSKHSLVAVDHSEPRRCE